MALPGRAFYKASYLKHLTAIMEEDPARASEDLGEGPPILLQASTGFNEAVEMLIQHGADVNAAHRCEAR